MPERLLIAAAFTLLLATAVQLSRWLSGRRTHRLARSAAPAELATLLQAAGPAVLYFTTPTCAQCRFQQAPALAQLTARRQDVQTVKLDALEQQSLASFYNVMTVPTTVVLDSQRRPVAVNHGLASAEQLEKQLATADTKRDTPK